jgi:DNA topoisomerase-1
MSKKERKTNALTPSHSPSPSSSSTTNTTLVLVESPSKCSTIEKYLGEGYRVMATYGHFRSIKSLKDIVFSKDLSTLSINFELDDSRKEKHIREIKKALEKSNGVVLATDDDREGEAIAWHICDYFGLSTTETPRIIFHEITKDAITTAIQNPGRINMNLVQAQFTRQVLDLFIGFKISPLLWTYISNNDKNSLSAGRCQTPALKMVVDNQTKINNTPTVLQYNVSGMFTSHNVLFHLTSHLSTREEIQEFLEKSKTHNHTIQVDNPTTATRNPPTPLNTSRLQQLASNEFHLSPKATMQICQHLYENGLITYMRTENTKYSRSFLEQTRKYLEKDGKSSSFTESPGKLTETNKMAHEAIRPTNLNVGFLPSAKYDNRTCKMYRLIWETSVASFMKPAIVSVIKATINGPDGLIYTHSAELPVYDGWKSIMREVRETNVIKDFSRQEVPGFKKNNSSAYHFLENISNNSTVIANFITAKQECVGTRNQLHYTESKLIRLLEEEGIGRPSTFASIVDKIQTRNYVSKENLEGTVIDCVDFSLDNSKIITSTCVNKTFGAEKNKLVVKPMGIVVSRFLYEHFEPLFNFSYTRETEALLDSIHQGNSNWIEVCANQKQYLSDLIKRARSGNIQKFQIPIDDTHFYTIAKYGPVIKQVVNPIDGVGESEIKWLPVRKDVDLIRLENGEYSLDELVKIKPDPGDSNFLIDYTPGGLPLYGGHYFGVYEDKEIIVRKGKFGRYVVWGEENRSIKCFGSRDVTNITFEEMIGVLAKPKRASGVRPPSKSTIKKSTASIEQIPQAQEKPPRSRKVPKAPKENPTEPPSEPPTEPPSEPPTEPTPKKRGRPKKSDPEKSEKKEM